MKPVVVIRHSSTEGAGFLATFLDANAIPWHMVCVDQGDAIPTDATQYSGIAMMGGTMSVNEPLPWIADEMALIRQAIALDIPLIGHCFGGQMISKALGGSVGANAVREIGWGEVRLNDTPLAKAWFGDQPSFNSFHWHYQTFTVPDGATHLLSSQYCQNQAFAFGKHLAMQCHIEMTEQAVNTWCRNWVDEMLEYAASPSVQQANQIQDNLTHKIASLNAVATHVYSHWIKGLSR